MEGPSNFKTGSVWGQWEQNNNTPIIEAPVNKGVR